MKRILANIVGRAITLFALFLTSGRAIWAGIDPIPAQRVFFANHTSNADMVLIWTLLPPSQRRRTRPVAASDYWLKNKLRAFVGGYVFNAVLIDRRRDQREEDPIAKIVEALDEKSSLIIFPEGQRNNSDTPLLPFKAGLYNIAKARPKVDLVPVWINNLNSVMPKGEIIPLPLICTVAFGAPIRVSRGEDKDEFLERAHKALLDLSQYKETR